MFHVSFVFTRCLRYHTVRLQHTFTCTPSTPSSQILPLLRLRRLGSCGPGLESCGSLSMSIIPGLQFHSRLSTLSPFSANSARRHVHATTYVQCTTPSSQAAASSTAPSPSSSSSSTEGLAQEERVRDTPQQKQASSERLVSFAPHVYEAKLDYAFHDRRWLSRAVHNLGRRRVRGWVSSATLPGEDSYEILEFLGDKVLSLTVAELLMRDTLAVDGSITEGVITRIGHALVCEGNLADIGRKKLDLSELLVHLLDVQDRDQLSDKMLCDAVEALIGAVYEDARECALSVRPDLQSGVAAAAGFAAASKVATNLITRKGQKSFLDRTDLQDLIFLGPETPSEAQSILPIKIALPSGYEGEDFDYIPRSMEREALAGDYTSLLNNYIQRLWGYCRKKSGVENDSSRMMVKYSRGDSFNAPNDKPIHVAIVECVVPHDYDLNLAAGVSDGTHDDMISSLKKMKDFDVAAMLAKHDLVALDDDGCRRVQAAGISFNSRLAKQRASKRVVDRLMTIKTDHQDHQGYQGRITRKMQRKREKCKEKEVR